MRKLLGGLLIVASIITGIATFIWVAVLGVIDVVDGAKADPTNGTGIVWGLFQFFALAELAGAVVFWALGIPGIVLLGSEREVRGIPFTGRNRSQKSPVGSSTWREEHQWQQRMQDD